MMLFYILMTFLAFSSHNAEAWGESKKVKLSDVQTLTLYNGRMTTGRRSAPVPQVQCVGGSAGCSAFVPEVIQCYNKGNDGVDVQWECKTEMDEAYRFGRIDVLCEGYEYPDDPYILQGSCGLEYTLDSTGKGYYKESAGHSYSPGVRKDQKSSSIANFAIFAVGLLVMYGLFKTCLGQQQRSRTNDDFTDNNGGGPRYPNAPPPPGFRTDYANDSCGGASRSYQRSAPSSGGASNFWTGAATGGMLGYMFGNRNTGAGQSSFFQQPTTNERSRSHSWGGGFGSSSSRTASGFGGTRRR